MSAKLRSQMIAMIALVSLFSVNCAQKAFNETEMSAKDKVISTETVFPTGDGEPGNGTINVDGTTGIGTGGTTSVGNGTIVVNPGGTPTPTPPGSTPTPTPPGSTPTPVGGTVSISLPGGTINITPIPASYIPVLYLCSNWGTANAGSLAQSQSLEVVVEGYKSDCNNAPVYCRFDGTAMKNWILTNKSISMPILENACPSLADGKYRVRILDTKTKKDILNPIWSNKITHNGGRYGGVVVTRTNFVWTTTEKFPFILVDANPPKIYNIKCDKSASPLIIHLNSDVNKAEKLELTHQSQGVFFDILGQNSYPAKNTQKRISWHRSHNYVYITLPDANGKVNGIDQLFGDNTMGPDGQLSANGYEALAKYDGMSADGKRRVRPADGFIDINDQIYHKLRIWRDRNFDGIAQANELSTMAAFGIRTIDLDYNADFDEWDKYGNRTRFKSVVEDASGKLHLLFDIWFNYLEQ